jgi:hypothetical protein
MNRERKRGRGRERGTKRNKQMRDSLNILMNFWDNLLKPIFDISLQLLPPSVYVQHYDKCYLNSALITILMQLKCYISE